MSTFHRDGRLSSAAMLAISLATLTGCGQRGPERFRVSGNITFADKPVPLGRVIFEPDVNLGNTGPQGFAPIENGRFDTSGPHCKGVIAGPTIVRIDGLATAGGEDAAASGTLLFPTYEQRVDLPRADVVRDFVVPSSVR